MAERKTGLSVPSVTLEYVTAHCKLLETMLLYKI